jgi:hypothetical protein
MRFYVSASAATRGKRTRRSSLARASRLQRTRSRPSLESADDIKKTRCAVNEEAHVVASIPYRVDRKSKETPGLCPTEPLVEVSADERREIAKSPGESDTFVPRKGIALIIESNASNPVVWRERCLSAPGSRRSQWTDPARQPSDATPALQNAILSPRLKLGRASNSGTLSSPTPFAEPP